MTVLTDITLHVLLGAASSAATAPAAWSGPVAGQFAPETVAEVVEAMVERYVGMWYRDFTFVQTTSYYYDDENVSRTETWYESLRLPGKLRIDVAPVEQGRILMFNDDTFYQFQGGELQGSNPRVHPLLLMGFDIYFMPVDEVLEKLEGLGVDLDEEVILSHPHQYRPVLYSEWDDGTPAQT